MLKEKIFYKEGLPINVITSTIDEYPLHFHDDMEVVYVLGGTVKLKNGNYTYTLKHGDIFILNPREIHSIYKTEELNMVMMLQIDIDYFSRYYGNLKNSFFVTNMKDSDDDSLEVLRNILARIMLEILNKGSGYEYKVIESTHNLISALLSNFQYFSMDNGQFVNEAKNMGNKVLAGRLKRITEYMYENYSRRLTLNEIAEQEHLSIYYLSHLIKEATGLSFQELLSFIRVEESEKLLLGTRKKIGVISEETGFSAVRYYIKYFTKWFEMHPSEYRKRFAGKVSSREIPAKYTLSSPESIMTAIKQQSRDVYRNYNKNAEPSLTIVELNLDEQVKTTKIYDKVLGILFDRENMKPASSAYKMLIDLNENIIAADQNYIITRLHRGGLDNDCFSILLYNINERLKEIAEGSNSLKETMEELEQFDDRAEILIKISGLTGEYKISRYLFSKENILLSYKTKLDSMHSIYKRERLTRGWATVPTSYFSTMFAVDTFNIQSNLTGLSAELILIDKAHNKKSD